MLFQAKLIAPPPRRLRGEGSLLLTIVLVKYFRVRDNVMLIKIGLTKLISIVFIRFEVA